MNNKFSIEVCSDLDFNEMVADISYEIRTLAMLTQENGVDSMEIKIFPQENSLKVPLNDFIESVVFARNSLIKMQKLPDN